MILYGGTPDMVAYEFTGVMKKRKSILLGYSQKEGKNLKE
jgi:hypothetical protein